MTENDRDFDDFLRRLLREEANAVAPSDDGLERIRARLTRPRPAPVAWVMAVFSGSWRRVQGAAASASAWLQTLPGTSWAWPRSPRGAQPQKWRSPAVLAGAAVVAVAASVLALTPLPGQAVSGTASFFRSIGGAHGSGAAGHGGGQAEGGGGPQPAPGASSSSPPGKHAHRHPSASPGPSVLPSATPGPGSASSSPSASPSPTPSASTSPCPTSSPSPSPSPSSSTGSGACPSPSPSTGPTTGPTTGSTPNPTP